MPAAAVGLLLASAVLHVGWNLILKRTPDRQLVTFWTMLGGTVVAMAAAAGRPALDGAGIRLALLSGALETVYIYLLVYAYHHHDFSQVYPIARGVAPAFLAVWTALLLGQRFSAGGLIGIALVVSGVMIVGGTGALREKKLVPLALSVGLCTSLYQLVDGAAVRSNDPLSYNAVVFGLMALGMAPAALTDGQGAARVLAAYWPRIAAGAVMTVACYGLVLIAFRMAPVAYAGATREVSVVLAALSGWLLLGERLGPRRVAGAVVVFGGIALLAVAR